MLVSELSDNDVLRRPRHGRVHHELASVRSSQLCGRVWQGNGVSAAMAQFGMTGWRWAEHSADVPLSTRRTNLFPKSHGCLAGEVHVPRGARHGTLGPRHSAAGSEEVDSHSWSFARALPFQALERGGEYQRVLPLHHQRHAQQQAAGHQNKAPQFNGTQRYTDV